MYNMNCFLPSPAHNATHGKLKFYMKKYFGPSIFTPHVQGNLPHSSKYFRPTQTPVVKICFENTQTSVLQRLVASNICQMCAQVGAVILTVKDDSAIQWRQVLLLLYHVLGGHSKDTMWAAVAKVC